MNPCFLNMSLWICILNRRLRLINTQNQQVTRKGGRKYPRKYPRKYYTAPTFTDIMTAHDGCG